MEHLAGALKKGGIKDLLAFFPPSKREGKALEEYLKKEGLPQVSDWWAKKQYAVVKESLVKELTEFCEREDTPEQVCFQIFTAKRDPSFLCRSSQRSSHTRKKHLFQRLN
jgi:hypothetical protein